MRAFVFTCLRNRKEHYVVELTPILNGFNDQKFLMPRVEATSTLQISNNIW
jgi:hypothetical protein